MIEQKRFRSIVLIVMLFLLMTAVAAAQETVHIVKKGETLWGIAQKYNINVNTLAQLNGIKTTDTLRVGMSLKLKETPQSYTVQSGDTLWSIAKSLGVDVQSLMDFNGIKDPETIPVGTVLKVPTTSSAASVSLPVTINGELPVSEDGYSWPAQGKVTSYFGWRSERTHEGIDLGVPIGTNIYAAKAGKVLYADWKNGYGRVIIIQHDEDFLSLYAHNSKLLVRQGETVQRGQLIALSGDSGRVTGPHLHFEIQFREKPVDPIVYLP